MNRHGTRRAFGAACVWLGAIGFFVCSPAPAGAQTPAIVSINPNSGLAGGPAFSLTVNGSGFISTSQVRWNGAPRTTTFNSATSLTAAIPASDVAGAGTALVQVFNGATGSNQAVFTINNPVPVISGITPNSAIAGGAAFTLTVSGSGFVSGSIVRWQGANRTTTFGSSTSLTASIPASDIATAGTRTVTVFTPAPGGGTSNAAAVTIETQPVTGVTLYFAEGATGFFTTTFDLFNPSTSGTAAITLRIVGDQGQVATRAFSLGPGGRQAIFLDSEVGGVVGRFGTIVESSLPIAGQRTMSWGAGGSGSSLERGIQAASPTWYFAEGATGNFDLYYLLLNPGPTTADVTIRFLREQGDPVTHTTVVPPLSRQTLRINSVPGLQSGNFGSAITSSVPIVAEQAMYFSPGGTALGAGAASAGASTLATTTHLAEGATGFFDEFLLLLNPSPTQTATATVLFRLPSGTTLSKAYSVGPERRATIWLNGEAQTDPALAALARTPVGATITSDLPLAVSRKMYWPQIEMPGFWSESSDALGTAVPATEWFLAGGFTGGPTEQTMFLLVINPTSTAGRVEVTLTPDGGAPLTQTFDLAPNARMTVDVGATFDVAGQPFSLAVKSVATLPAVPIVVEAAHYGSPGGQFWATGGASLGSTMPPPPMAPPDLTITKSHAGAFTQGRSENYSVTISNAGGSPTTGTVTVVDTLPVDLRPTAAGGTGWTCQIAAQGVTCTRSDPLPSGQSYPAIVLTVAVQPNAPASVTNTAVVSGGGDANPSNNTATDATTIVPGADLAITKSHTGNFTQGQTGTYTLTVSNVGGSATNGSISVIDSLPAGLTSTASTGTGWSCTAGSQSVACLRNDPLNPGASYPTITLTVTVASSAPASVTNTAQVAGGSDVNSGDNSASDPTTIITVSDVTLTKTHTGSFLQGQVGATYTLTVSNVGAGATSSPVMVSDTLPAGLVPTAAAGAGWACNIAAQNVTCSRSGALNGGASYPAITLTVNVSPAAPLSLVNTAMVSGGGEINTGNNTAADITTIGPGPDLTINKSHSGSFGQGQTGATFTITVSNRGSAPTSGVMTATDSLPAGLVPASAAGAGWTCNLSGQTVTCSRSDPLAPEQSFPAIALTVNVQSNAPASVTNTAAVSGGGDVNPANNSATDTVLITPRADLTITKSHTGNFTQGQVGATYTLTVANAGVGPTTAPVTVIDRLPLGLTPTAAVGSGWTCEVNAQDVVCSRGDALAAGAMYPPMTLTVSVAVNAPATVTNVAQVAGGGDSNAANNSAADPTTVVPPPP